jgi:hypothetical protein
MGNPLLISLKLDLAMRFGLVSEIQLEADMCPPDRLWKAQPYPLPWRPRTPMLTWSLPARMDLQMTTITRDHPILLSTNWTLSASKEIKLPYVKLLNHMLLTAYPVQYVMDTRNNSNLKSILMWKIFTKDTLISDFHVYCLISLFLRPMNCLPLSPMRPVY